jgi:hypothetical protein
LIDQSSRAGSQTTNARSGSCLPIWAAKDSANPSEIASE